MAEYGSSDNTPLNKFFDKDFYTVGVQAKWNLFDLERLKIIISTPKN